MLEEIDIAVQLIHLRWEIFLSVIVRLQHYAISIKPAAGARFLPTFFSSLDARHHPHHRDHVDSKNHGQAITQEVKKQLDSMSSSSPPVLPGPTSSNYGQLNELLRPMLKSPTSDRQFASLLDTPSSPFGTLGRLSPESQPSIFDLVAPDSVIALDKQDMEIESTTSGLCILLIHHVYQLAVFSCTTDYTVLPNRWYY